MNLEKEKTTSENTYTPSVCVLMATYNGEKYLAEQILSIENQTHTNWKVVISDDGSMDATLEIAREFQSKWGSSRVIIRSGPSAGFCQNFLSMACDPQIRADFYAFSDQDDVWMKDKLARSIAYFIEANESQLPRVYCGRTTIVDEGLNFKGYSPLFSLPRSFRNALVQSIAGGNTMVFNQAVKELLEVTGMQHVVSHDWWLYQLVKGVGGVVFYDPKPLLLYRQHAHSLVGANSSLIAKLSRILYVLKGRFKNWNNINYQALINIRVHLTKDNQDILDTYGRFRDASLKDRVRLLEVCGLYRQTWRGTMSLWLATILNRM
jgi:glycosyltransferase involved in cell wall biosynthesis